MHILLMKLFLLTRNQVVPPEIHLDLEKAIFLWIAIYTIRMNPIFKYFNPATVSNLYLP